MPTESPSLPAGKPSRSIRAVVALAPKMLHKLKNAPSPVCHLKTPWLAPDEA